MTYQPEERILENYAKVMINFAPWKGKGIKKGDTVLLQVPECAKPMLRHLRNQVLKSGGYPIIQYLPDDMSKDYFEIASEEQISHFPEKYLKGKVDEVDVSIYVIANTNRYELKDVDPKKIMLRQKSMKQYIEWRNEKENNGKFFWTLCMYPTQHMADDVGLSLEEYWNEVIKACYLDEEDPIKKWQEIENEIERVKTELNNMPIETLHITGEDVDLKVGIGKNRKWLGGSGHNIPSFEVFISPNKFKTEGKIFFNQPLYSHGNRIKNITLEFKEGKIINSSAEEGEELLKEMIKTEGADMIGEYSLTDGRLSKITKFMGETLYDENVGGEQGNTHLAIGNAYKDSFTGNPSEVSKEQWEEMGYNESVVHTDIISTTKRTVTAHLEDGSTKIIYDDGKFII